MKRNAWISSQFHTRLAHSRRCNAMQLLEGSGKCIWGFIPILQSYINNSFTCSTLFAFFHISPTLSYSNSCLSTLCYAHNLYYKLEFVSFVKMLILHRIFSNPNKLMFLLLCLLNLHSEKVPLDLMKVVATD